MDWPDKLGAIVTAAVPALDFASPFAVGLAAVGIGIFLVTIYTLVIISSVLRNLRQLMELVSKRPTRKQRVLAEKDVDLALAKARHELDALRFEQAALRDRRRYQRPFSRLGVWRRFADRMSAVLAALTPAPALTSELAGFAERVALTGDSAIARMRAKIAQFQERMRTAPDEFERGRKAALDERDLEINFITARLAEIKADVAAHLAEIDKEEEAARRIVEAWRDRLCRPAYVDNFTSIFEDNLNRWRARQNKSSISPSDDEKKNSYSGETTPSLTFAYFFKKFRSWLKTFRGMAGSAKAFAYIAFVPELLYSYTAFNALASGDKLTAVSATIVFTFGLLVAAQMAGTACGRARYREGPPETAEPRWNVLMGLAACFLTAVGGLAVYVGGSLRGSTATIIRLQNAITENIKEQTNPEIAESLRQQIEAIIQHPPSPLFSSEGQGALFVYGVFFLSVLMQRLFSSDPVFEYGLAMDHLVELIRQREWIRLFGSIAQRSAEASLANVRKLRAQTENEGIVASEVFDTTLAEQELQRLEALVKSYRNARLRCFGNALAKLRRASAPAIVTWLDEQCPSA